MWGSLQTLPHHSEAATSSHSLLDPSGPWVFTVAHLMLPGGMDYSSECGRDLTSPLCDAQNHSPVLVFAQHLFLPTSAAVDNPSLSALPANHLFSLVSCSLRVLFVCLFLLFFQDRVSCSSGCLLLCRPGWPHRGPQNSQRCTCFFLSSTGIEGGLH